MAFGRTPYWPVSGVPWPAAVRGGSFVRAADALGSVAAGVSLPSPGLEARLGHSHFRNRHHAILNCERTPAAPGFLSPEVGPLLEGIDDSAALASGSRGCCAWPASGINVDYRFLARVMLRRGLADCRKRYPNSSLNCLTRDGKSAISVAGRGRYDSSPRLSVRRRAWSRWRATPFRLKDAHPDGRGGGARYLQRGMDSPTSAGRSRNHACIQFREKSP